MQFSNPGKSNYGVWKDPYQLCKDISWWYVLTSEGSKGGGWELSENVPFKNAAKCNTQLSVTGHFKVPEKPKNPYKILYQNDSNNIMNLVLLLDSIKEDFNSQMNCWNLRIHYS